MTPEKRLEKIKKSISKLSGNENLIANLLNYVEQKDREIKIFKPWKKCAIDESMAKDIWGTLSGVYTEGHA